MARVASMNLKQGEAEVRKGAQQYFNAMGRSTRTISRLQLSPEVLARVSPPLRAADEELFGPLLDRCRDVPWLLEAPPRLI